MAKFEIRFSKKVQTERFENLEVALSAEFDDKDITHDCAFNLVREKVNQWVEQELIMMGLKLK